MKQFLGTVRARVVLAFAACMAITLAVGGFGLYGIASLKGALHDMYGGNLAPMADVAAIRVDVLNIRYRLTRMRIQNDARHSQAIREQQAEIERTWKHYYPDGVSSDAERVVADKLNTQLPQFRSAVAKELDMLERGDVAGADQWHASSVAGISDSLTDLTQNDFDINRDQARDSDTTSAALAARLTWIASAIGLCGAIVCIGSAVYLLRAIMEPLTRSVSFSNQIAEGRLDSEIATVAPGEFGVLLATLKSMAARLALTVGGIRDASESVTLAASEIAAGNMDLSARTEEQASSLEQTAASMAQLTETVKQNADNAREANVLAAEARDMTNTGNVSVGQMMETITEISAHSARIADITGMIEGIAFQTNILALNAAVEAARAGDQGRGFAVVASEVRALAQRSSAAAKEIKVLIDASSEKVRQGEQQAAGVGETMGNVSHAIRRVSDIVGEISTASDEQSKGIEQVHQAITQIDDVTQQNAALVEQAAAAAQSLQEQSDRMKHEVMVFRLPAAGAVSSASA
ncbi:hypothetical protein LMG27952_06664 [Paraburkholderia hiiakae]|uniref:Methyl-accepting chemotaxis protein n=1 Tax=Paraburkholderia hiiakae TaxID=1081782 RepID=A0ABN7IG47_9BURK|nr:methyl-accepting chemotaxis protein [Paraburkholderia hiiakae]CAD6558647.1 hypothetical protein LMG27952_06664 [Paraburkholderia hiiakae]